MGDQQIITKKAAGLYSHPNKLHAVPNGALAMARNAAIDREGVLSKRRGFGRYGTTLSAPALGLFEYLETLLVQDGTSMKYDSDGLGTWASWSGTFSPPVGSRMKSLESNLNFYFTTSMGVYKNDSLTNAPVRSGMPQGLDINAGPSGTPGWLANNTQVSYRILWGRTDANNNLLLGPPSYPELVANNSGASSNVQLIFTVPDGLKTGDFYEIYRTEASGTSVSPGDRHFKIIRNVPASYAHASSVTYLDDNDPVNLGDSLYTNDLNETIDQANDRPPYAQYMALFKGHVFYGPSAREQEQEIQLLNVTGFSNGFSYVIIQDAVGFLYYTVAAAENAALQQWQISNSGDPTLKALDIRNSAKSLVRVINRDPSNTRYYAFYTSGADDPPGKIAIRARDLNTTPFTLHYGGPVDLSGKFSPSLPTTGDNSLISSNGFRANVISRSKFQRPEAVPFFNTMEIGRANKAILGLVALKDALFVYKEDGIYSISGETDGGGGFNFVVNEVDSTIKLICPDSLVTLDNSAYGFTTQGVIRATEGGSLITSRAIENDLNEIAQIPNFATICHAASYESDRKFLFCTPESASNTNTKKTWVYNYLTNAWTDWGRGFNALYVLSTDQRLYACHTTDAYVLRERKSFQKSNEDYLDETVDATVTSVGTTTVNGVQKTTVTVTYTYSANLTVGWLYEKDDTEGKITAVTFNGGSSYTLTLGQLITTTTGTCQLSMPIDMFVEWAPETAGNAGVMKQFSACQIYQEEDFALTNKIGFFADTQTEREFVSDIAVTRKTGWGTSPWGSTPWGDGQEGTSTPIRTFIPRNHQRCRSLRVFYRHAVAKEAVNILQMTLDVRMYGERTAREPVSGGG